MTRLVSTDIKNIPAEIEKYDLELKRKTGSSLKDIAIIASGLDKLAIEPASSRVAVIPVTVGLGPISGFSDAVCAIADHLGFSAFVTSLPDVGGLDEAFKKEAEIVMLADDYLFAAFNLQNRKVINNDEATARGYVAALNCMAGSLDNKAVLLAGAGRLGSIAADLLAQLQVDLILFDPDRNREKQLAERISDKYGVEALFSLELQEALDKCDAVFDASPGDAFIKGRNIKGGTLVAAPGMPFGLDPEAYDKVAEQTIHDPLQIGVAAMLYCSLAESRS